MQRGVDQPQSICTGRLEGRTSHEQVNMSLDGRFCPLLNAGLLSLLRPVSAIVPCFHISTRLLHIVAEVVKFDHLVKL